MRKRAPTNAELEVQRVLWQRGASPVRDVHGSLDRARPVGYTTVLKLLQIMVEKRRVRRNASARSHVYAAVASRGATQRRMVADLVRRVFGGSTLGLVPHAPGSTPPTGPEPGQIRRLPGEEHGGP